IRKQAYITGHTVPKANLDVLDKLIATRHDLAQGDLGRMYHDLYVRKEKYPWCALFTIKGGRHLSETEYQLPIVAL
ncbi:hypothetical protein KI387_024761, partial [Taxus chinensis]